MNLKGKFKNIGSGVVSDLTIVAGMGVGRKVLSFIPDNIAGKDINPAVKGGAAYLLTKMFAPSTKKGIVNNLITGAQLGFASVVAAPILSKVGIAGTQDSYVAGEEFIKIGKPEVTSESMSNNASVSGVL